MTVQSDQEELRAVREASIDAIERIAALARKYGRDWRIHGLAFDEWVAQRGPFRVHEDPETP